jgi:site-specific DNA-cytosine methylase
VEHKLKIGSLFSGYGGLDMAIEEFIDGETVWHVEFDKAPVAFALVPIKSSFSRNRAILLDISLITNAITSISEFVMTDLPTRERAPAR